MVIPGATGVSYTIPAGHALGTYDYTVAIDCPTSPACADQSDPAAVAVVQQPVEVGATLRVDLDSSGTGVLFHWTDVAGAADYVLYSGTDPAATFTDEVGSSVSGSTGIGAPIPPGNLVLYRVAGRNPVCGVGPQR